MIESTGFIDGDLIERFLSLDHSSMAEVAKELSISVAELSGMVEELSRLH